MELLDRLARLVTPPRIHKHRYCGVLAPNANIRRAVIESPALLPARSPPQGELAFDQDGDRWVGVFRVGAIRVFEGCLGPLGSRNAGQPLEWGGWHGK
mgnify:CR=1 FL=1